MKYIILVAILFSFNTQAAETWGVINTTSYHVNSKQKPNQNNYGVGIEYHDESLVYLAGAYKNSVDKTSVYGMIGWMPIEVGAVKMGVAAGVVNGYPRMNNGGIAPAVVGMVSVEFEKVGANVMIIPGYKDKAPLTFGFQVKFKF